MHIEVQDNPNCTGCDIMVFQELGPARPIKALLADFKGQDMLHDVVAVDPNGEFKQAHARKVADSGEGHALLIYGGSWGIRLRPKLHAHEDWGLENSHQAGEAYKVYASENDIVYN